ncbi:MAG TPA: hypothetical protein VH061_13725 [Solirubrobacteraceae bacterium]|nr:hypothetical protein [Solirubrobacteraceae bacterium]
MSTRTRIAAMLGALVLCATLVCVAGAGAASAASAWWTLDTVAAPTNLHTGEEGVVMMTAVNNGYRPLIAEAKPVTFTDTLPPGLKITKIEGAAAGVYKNFKNHKPVTLKCTIEAEGRVIKCPFEGILTPSESIRVRVNVEVESSFKSAKNLLSVEGGSDPTSEAVTPAKLEREFTASNEPTPFGHQTFEMVPEGKNGEVLTQAGAHPFQFTTTFDFNDKTELTHFFGSQIATLSPASPAMVKNVHFVLPRGLIGDVAGRAKCTEADFTTFFTGHFNACAQSTVLGVSTVTLLEPDAAGLITAPVPLFNLVPAPGEPARFGFELFEVPVVLTTKVLPENDYAVEVSVHYASEAADVLGSQVTFWGVPASETHDESRGWSCIAEGAYIEGAESPPPCITKEKGNQQAFLDMPTNCEELPTATATGESWNFNSKGEQITFGGEPDDEFHFALFTGCNRLPFSPTVTVEADKHEAATPSGMTVSVEVPQGSTLSGEEGQLEEATVRKTTLTLPQGIMAAGGAANGLLTCSNGQFGFAGSGPFDESGSEAELGSLTSNAHFNTAKIECPDQAKVGTVEIVTPLLEHHLTGSVYLAHVDTAPFKSPLILFLVAEDEEEGVTVKLAGEVKPDPATGELTSVFRETPPVPFSSLKLHLMDGPRATQSTPETCGTFPGKAAFVGWNVAGASEAERDASAYHPSDPTLTISSGAGGSPCSAPGTQPFAPGFQAGSQSTQAGAFSPFIVNLERPDGQQALRTLSVHLPLGAAAMLASVNPCPIAQARADACSAESEVGHSIAVAGLGGDPVTIGGAVYLTSSPGPGVPFGLMSVTDASHVGPFNLGHILVLSGITVNETTAQATVTSEPLPQFVKGVPSQIKRLSVVVDRPEFTFNPTSCGNLETTATLTGYGPGGSVGVSNVSSPYHASNCAALPFKPTIAVNVESDVSRLDGTGMKIVVKSGKGQANIHLTKLVFPNTVPSRLTTIQKACPVQTFEKNPATCPEGSVIGSAIARTPVLKSPLTGPAYLVSHANESFPDAVFVLQGEGIKLILDGKTNIKNGVTSSTFASIPDAPVESFEVTLPRGPHSAFSGFGNLCEKPIEVPTTFGGQNGALIEGKTLVTVEKCAKTAVKGTKKESELAKLLKQCKKAKKHKVRVKCEATAHKRVKAINSCKAKNKKSKKKLASCEAKARKTYALKLK